MSVLSCCGGARFKVSLGVILAAALGIALWAVEPADSVDIAGRRLFEQWSTEAAQHDVAGMQVQGQESIPTCKTLMRLFKTVAASPQAALHRMSKTGRPNLEEWTTSIQDWKWGLSRSQISAMFSGIDASMDGQVDMGELLGCFRRGKYEGQFWQAASPPAASFQPVHATHSQYDCHDGLEMWRFEWSKEKQESCSLISASELRGSLHPGLTPTEVVQKMDINGDGVISHDEWVAAATGFARNTPFAKPLIEPRAEFAFKSIDVTQDGSVDVKDIVHSLGLPAATSSLRAQSSAAQREQVTATALKGRILARWATLANAFQKMDKDDNHRLSREEFGAGLAELRPPIEDSKEVSHLFAGIDALRDDRITPPEWHGTLQSGQLFQSEEALQQVLHMSPAFGSSWIHRTPSSAEASPLSAHPGVAQAKDGDTDLSTHLTALSSRAEGEFRKKASQWAGSMKSACLKMGLLRADAITPGTFDAAVGSFEPLLADENGHAIFTQMDEDKDGLIKTPECYLTPEELRTQLSQVSSLRNVFCDADFNNDGQLSREEFAKLGQQLNKKSSGEKYAAYFDDEFTAKGQKVLDLATLNALAGKPSASKDVLSKEEGAKYGLPAIIHGKCIIAVKGDEIPAGMSDKVGSAFSNILSQKLDVDIRVAGAQEQQGTTSKEFDILYTSKTQQGADVMQKLQANAASIQAELQQGIAAMMTSSVSTTAWCSSSLDFYGPQASKLPKGQRIKQEFGQLAGHPVENASPYVAVG